MKKLPTFLTILILLSLLVCTTNGFASGGGTPSQPITYKTEIKVKLLPASSTFTATLNGTYEIVNMDDNTLIPYSSSVKFSTLNGKVIVEANGTSTSSAKGFKINEITDTESNEVTISKILTAYGVNDVRYRGSFEVLPTSKAPLLFNRLGIENYLKGVVSSEMPSSWHMEALKAQAVAARSYAYTQILYSKSNGGYLEMTVASQVYGGKTKESERGNQAVKETDSLYAVYDNKPIHAFFHSSSGGYTENSENVWTSEVPYLKAVEDSYDRHPGNYHYGWESISQASVLSQKLKLSSNQVLAGVKVVERGPSSAVQQMRATIYDKTTKEKTNITLLPTYLNSPDALRSFFGISLKSIKFNVYSDAAVKIKMADGTEMSSDHLVGYKMKMADGNTSYIEDINLPVRTLNASTSVKTAPSTFSFKGDGWGHLLGLSQWGARGMAEAGFTYDEILKHYYTGIEIKRMQL